MFQSFIRLHWVIFAATLGFASVVEWAHMRKFQEQGDWVKVAFTMTAAISAGYMASEALEQKFPTWKGYGYE